MLTAFSAAMFAVAFVAEMGAFWCIAFAGGFVVASFIAICTEGNYIKRIELLERRVNDLEQQKGRDDDG